MASSTRATLGWPGVIQTVCVIRLNIYAANKSKSATINSTCGIAQRQRTGIRLRPLIHEAINNKESA
ncbi:hypothetical protein D5R55_30065 [Burkholderia cenocepacia]|uniref:Uncharacterized protein n=1 Tax=Burkholderia cenocepacia TaxID=95486 RepID=A0A3S9NHC1_9BURK|nr:hypothetical protein D5R55_30065 [Burkholderia cenocepacia]